MGDLSPDNLESKLEDLKNRVENLPDCYKPVARKALELCQRGDITVSEYESQIRAFPEIKKVNNDRNLLAAIVLAEDIIFRKETRLAYV